MSRQDDESRLQWRDVLVIATIVAVLTITFLVQLARRSDVIPAAGVLHDIPVLQAVEALIQRVRTNE